VSALFPGVFALSDIALSLQKSGTGRTFVAEPGSSILIDCFSDRLTADDELGRVEVNLLGE
jgi:hypothetical protein